MGARGRSNSFTLRQLDIFVSAAQTGSFALAADRFGISQPAVSDHIRTLETHLGQRLFDRRRGTTPLLTTAGEELLERAIGLLSASDTLWHGTPVEILEEPTAVRLAVTSRVGEGYIKPVLARIFRELPHLDIELRPPIPLGHWSAALEFGEVDLVIGATDRLPADIPNLHVLQSVPLSLVAAPAIAARMAQGDATLETMPIVLPSYAQSARPWFETQLATGGLHRRRPLRFVEFSDVIQGLVEDGLALAILLDEEIRPAIVAGRFVRLNPRLEPMLRVIARSPRAPQAAEAVEQMLIHAIGDQRWRH